MGGGCCKTSCEGRKSSASAPWQRWLWPLQSPSHHAIHFFVLPLILLRRAALCCAVGAVLCCACLCCAACAAPAEEKPLFSAEYLAEAELNRTGATPAGLQKALAANERKRRKQGNNPEAAGSPVLVNAGSGGRTSSSEGSHRADGQVGGKMQCCGHCCSS